MVQENRGGVVTRYVADTLGSVSLHPNDIFFGIGEELSKAIKTIVDLAGGFVNLMLGQQPVRGCPEPYEKWEARACLGGCLVTRNLKVCFTIPGGPSVESKIGFCGFPSLSIEAGVRYNSCK